MDLNSKLQRIDRFQQRRRWLAVAVAVAKKFSDDGASRQAALVAYYAFFSLFPLLLVFVTVLGFVLHGDRSAQRAIEHSVLAQFPILGTRIHPRSLRGSAIGLAVGIVTSLLSGLGVTGAMQNALNTVWAVPIKDRPGFLPSRLRGLALLVLIGVLFASSSAAAGLVSGGLGGPLAKVGGILISLAVDLALFAAAFRLMTPSSVPWRDLRLGVGVAACFWEILQAAGGYYIGHVLAHTQSDLADVSLVIGLLLFLHLGAQVTLYAAEINVVVSRRLWPRSYFSSPQVPADELVLQALARAQQRSPRQHIEVAFDRRGEEAQQSSGASD